MKKDLISFLLNIKVPLFLIAILWIIEAGNQLFHLDLKFLGIYPRELSGLPGIFTSPFIHASWGHLASNTAPILILTSIIVLFYKKVAVQSYMMIMTGTGFLVWLFARESYHIGASGVIYGLVSFVFWSGVFKKNIKSIILALIVLTLYSGMFTNMFPNVEEHISWESHLFGAITGLITAFVFRNVIEIDEEIYLVSPWKEDNNPRQYFLPRDIFEKTKMEKYLEQLEKERARAENERLEREH